MQSNIKTNNGQWIKSIPSWNGYGWMRFNCLKKDGSVLIGYDEIVLISNGYVGRINYEEDFAQSELMDFEFWSERLESPK